MVWFEYLAFKRFPMNLKNVRSGYIESKNKKKAEYKLERKYNDVLIIREIE
jgi:hypothetical protein